MEKQNWRIQCLSMRVTRVKRSGHFWKKKVKIVRQRRKFKEKHGQQLGENRKKVLVMCDKSKLVPQGRCEVKIKNPRNDKQRLEFQVVDQEAMIAPYWTGGLAKGCR